MWRVAPARRLPIGNFAVGLPLEVMRVDQRLPVWLVHNFASADECQHIVKTFESMLRLTSVLSIIPKIGIFLCFR